ncbi:unnamed protein product [Allacma fusca]|uniref:Uncharacterized protein n=1 Tax=Allacma fusca TaxID=39272 RepID=A0A8J2P3U9_9HEXA|nr:unnamed protein product [Allacma fusca]
MAIAHNITHLSLSDLFNLLRKIFPSDDLPLNPRSLLRTPVLVKTILQLGKGKFYYFGVKENVGRRLSTGFKLVELPRHVNFVGLEKENVISISVGIDGLPVCKSNNKAFWPILTLVNQASDSTPFIVGIYFGSEKPPIDGFLENFIDECKGLETDDPKQGNSATDSPVDNDSYVCFHEKGFCIAGIEAKNQGIVSLESTIFDAQRMVGRQFIDPHVQNDMKTWPFKIESDKAGRPLIVVKNKRFSPEEVTAEVLKHLKKLSENHLKRSVTKAVITVPTNFNNKQREATRQSALLAGLEVLQIINEPSAAAMAYSLYWKNEEKIILVFNLGGKTFDVTILKTKLNSTNATDYQSSPATSRKEENIHFQYGESRLQILQTGGDTHLGGDNCNNGLALR